MVDLSQLHFLKSLAALTFVDTIYLYGSRARGNARSRSDIDLAIQTFNAAPNDWNIIDSIVENADTLLKIDCVNLEKIKNEKLRENILKDGIILFRRSTPWVQEARNLLIV